MAMETQTTHLLEVLQTEILARLPLKTISRFKSVCKKWKSTIESPYFRRLFLSLNRNSSSSSSWSLMCGQQELIVFHGRKTWDLDLPKSPASLIPSSFKRYHIGDCVYRDSSGGLVLITDGSDKAYCYVGSPVLHQWIKIPPPPSDPTGDSSVFGLVTRWDEDGVVLSFKVVRLASYQVTNDYMSSDLNVLLYSSETGVWTPKVVHSPIQIGNMSKINLNGTIYFGCLSVPGILLAHDFYSESNQFRVVGLPDYPSPDHNKDYKRTLTTSGGSVVYVRTLAKTEETVLKIWRLMNNDDNDSWQLLWEVGFPICSNYAPMAMHPFDVATVYLWSQQDHHLVSCNLRKGDYSVLGDASKDCFIDQSVCKKSVDELWYPRSSDEDEDLNFQVCIWLFQFVIPRWIESVPRPPNAEMIDTTSLLSHATATHERMMREHEKMMRERAAIMGDESNDDYFWMG